MTDPPAAVRAVETHLSWVFMAGDRAFKLPKPVSMPFLDLSEPELRMAAMRRELELNARIAPDVYLGLADVMEQGELTDQMIVMRRLPADRRLSQLAGTSEFAGCLRAVARTVAAFHAGQEPILHHEASTSQALERDWNDNFEVTEALVDAGVPAEVLPRVRGLVERYLAGRRPLFELRSAEGFVRDGHGDLIADDVFCMDDGPRIIDCLAFNDDWRIGDVLADIAFLVMDVHRVAGPAEALALLGWYQEFSGEHHPSSLAHHYVAYRAHVRAKVACLRWRQGDDDAAGLARRYHDLTLHHLERGRVRLVLVGGGPGTGKTVLADGLADELGWAVVRTDDLRRGVASAQGTTSREAAPGAGFYDESGKNAVYEELLRQAAALLGAGESVVLDASWTDERHRRAAREVAETSYAELVEFECRLDPAEAKRRIEARRATGVGNSDATAEVVDHLRGRRDPWDAATGLDTSQAVVAVLDQAVRTLHHRTEGRSDAPNR
ncbi:MAG: AAA family ATPase [Microthrixaceae bacterium]